MKRFLSVAVLAAVLVIALTACAAGGGNKVTVTLTDFGIEASRSDFEAGGTYTFVITNEGAIPHEFVIAQPLMESDMPEEGDTHEEGDAHEEGDTPEEGDAHAEGEMHHEGLIVEVEEEELPAGATVTVEVTFPSPAPDEPVEYACHTEGHYEAGMHAPITVK